MLVSESGLVTNHYKPQVPSHHLTSGAGSAFPLRQGLNAAERIKFGSQLCAEPRHLDDFRIPIKKGPHPIYIDGFFRLVRQHHVRFTHPHFGYNFFWCL